MCATQPRDGAQCGDYSLTRNSRASSTYAQRITYAQQLLLRQKKRDGHPTHSVYKDATHFALNPSATKGITN